MSFAACMEQENPTLFSAILRFNYPKIEDLELSHLPSQYQSCVADKNVLLLFDVQPDLLAQCLWENSEFYEQFALEQQRLALLSCKELAQLALYVGIALHHKAIAHVITRQQVLELKQSIGVQGYDFALRRAPWMLGSSLGDFAHIDGDQPLVWRIQHHGVNIVNQWVCSYHQSAGNKIYCRLPEAFNSADKDIANQFDEYGARDLWQLIKKVLLSEVEPKWKTCFE